MTHSKLRYGLDFQISPLVRGVSCRIQWIHFNVFVNHFWHPEVIKMQSQKAKITEPDTYFLKTKMN
jgi:hypothetical protein